MYLYLYMRLFYFDYTKTIKQFVFFYSHQLDYDVLTQKSEILKLLHLSFMYKTYR